MVTLLFLTRSPCGLWDPHMHLIYDTSFIINRPANIIQMDIKHSVMTKIKM